MVQPAICRQVGIEADVSGGVAGQQPGDLPVYYYLEQLVQQDADVVRLVE
jgi:hypothetical protein